MRPGLREEPYGGDASSADVIGMAIIVRADRRADAAHRCWASGASPTNGNIQTLAASATEYFEGAATLSLETHRALLDTRSKEAACFVGLYQVPRPFS
jgi:hypothetical protein